MAGCFQTSAAPTGSRRAARMTSQFVMRKPPIPDRNFISEGIAVPWSPYGKGSGLSDLARSIHKIPTGLFGPGGRISVVLICLASADSGNTSGSNV